MVMEAVCLKVAKEDEAQRKESEKKNWKKDTSHLKDLV